MTSSFVNYGRTYEKLLGAISRTSVSNNETSLSLLASRGRTLTGHRVLRYSELLLEGEKVWYTSVNMGQVRLHCIRTQIITPITGISLRQLPYPADS